MGIQLLDAVVLVTDLPAQGLKAGDLGAVVHSHSAQALEVEFVLASGHTQAVVTLTPSDLRPVKAHDLVSVRTVGQA